MKVPFRFSRTLGLMAIAAFLAVPVGRVAAQARRAALDQWWIPTDRAALGFTSVGQGPAGVRADGADLWVAHREGGVVMRLRASDGRVLETWTGATRATGVVIVGGKIYVSGGATPNGAVYVIDPRQPAGSVTTLTTALDAGTSALTFDGARIWTANPGIQSVSSVSIITLNPVTVTNVRTGFSNVRGILWDGTNIWVTDEATGSLLKLDSSGGILQTVPVGDEPRFPIFDGQNIWVPSQGQDTVTVVQASTGNVLQTISGNGLSQPIAAAFDGKRILVTNFGDSVSLFRASDGTPLGSVGTGADSNPFAVCSDGINFFFTLFNSNQLGRF